MRIVSDLNGFLVAPNLACSGVVRLTRTGQIAVEAFTCLLIFKNIFSFILTFFAYDWLVNHGIRPAFLAISSIQMVVCLLGIPMCKFDPVWLSDRDTNILRGR